MLISQLIATLQDYQTAHGDLPVYCHDNEGWRVSPATDKYPEVVTRDDPETYDSDGNPLPPLYW